MPSPPPWDSVSKGAGAVKKQHNHVGLYDERERSCARGYGAAAAPAAAIALPVFAAKKGRRRRNSRLREEGWRGAPGLLGRGI